MHGSSTWINVMACVRMTWLSSTAATYGNPTGNGIWIGLGKAGTFCHDSEDDYGVVWGEFDKHKLLELAA